MNHNLRLNDLAAETARRALADINMSVQSARSRLDRSEDAEIRACLGTIGDAAWRLDQIVFHTDRDDSEYGIDTSRHPSRHRVRIVDDAVVDEAPVHGIARPLNLVRCADDCTCKGNLP